MKTMNVVSIAIVHCLCITGTYQFEEAVLKVNRAFSNLNWKTKVERNFHRKKTTTQTIDGDTERGWLREKPRPLNASGRLSDFAIN